MKKLISICGSDVDDDNLSQYALEVAEKVGKLIALKGGVLVCGGLGGVMKAACRGAKEENGITVGILPNAKKDANECIDIAIPTNIGNVRNYLVANSGDAVIAIGGRWGTLNEISYSMISEKPLILIKGTGGCVDQIINGNIMQDIESHYYIVNSAEEAVEKAFNI
ncbi:MAG: TIGR00725 family protein [Thermoplasmatales archaeon]|nr:MAG: TIGR00725 family protein [Thermoplasmatales archaeon]